MKLQHPGIRHVMAQTDNGRLIFKHYGIPIGTLIASPLVPYSQKPTFIVAFCKTRGKYRFYDSSSSTLYREGDAVDFILHKYYHSNIRTAIAQINKDLNL
jgi:hypothetical protein